MDFEELNDTIPYCMGGKLKVLSMEPYPGITLGMPGRHQKETTPKGGDFVVMVTDPSIGWKLHQFTHNDIFQQIERRLDKDPTGTAFLMADYLSIIKGSDPSVTLTGGVGNIVSGMKSPKILDRFLFFRAVQCLAVAEHRRYAMHEAKFGGRFLPFRFAAGIAEGLWTATDAAEKQRRGRPGVEWLERDYGLPVLTEELMNP